jgi:hypothetical protein
VTSQSVGAWFRLMKRGVGEATSDSPARNQILMKHESKHNRPHVIVNQSIDLNFKMFYIVNFIPSLCIARRGDQDAYLVCPNQTSDVEDMKFVSLQNSELFSPNIYVYQLCRV